MTNTLLSVKFRTVNPNPELKVEPMNLDLHSDICVRFRGDSGYVNLYYLAPQYRDQGWGRFLDGYAVSYLTSLGFSAARLSVSPTNLQAMRFYAKQGWTDLGPRPDAPEVHLMGRDL